MTSSVWRSSVRPVGAALIVAAAAIAAGPALAQPSDRCNPERIVATIDSNHAVPSLRGCLPDAVRAALHSRDYGLSVDNRHSSNSIPAGGIVSQRVESRMVYVDLSTGPDDQPNVGGQQAEGHGHHGGALDGVAGEVAQGVLGAIFNHPPAGPQVPPDEPAPPQYQPPPQYEPPPAAPVAPPVVAAPAPPPPAVKPPPHHEVEVAQAEPQPAPDKGQNRPPAAAARDNPPPVAQLPAEPTPAPPAKEPAAPTLPTPAPQPSIEQNQIRDRRDIVQNPSWWATLLGAVSSSPLLAAAIAAAVAIAAAAALAKILWPRATCSIERGSFALRPLPLRSAWPGLHVDTIMGSAAFSIPRPLPIRRLTDVEPSPA
ncbi:MAG TPA: hypothetical protein VIV07_01310 [Sphingomicrobium sp.]